MLPPGPPTPPSQAEVADLLVITFSAQGAPVAQGQAEVRALRDAMLKVGHRGPHRAPWAAVPPVAVRCLASWALKSSDLLTVLRGKLAQLMQW